jgi:hypothetical protein
VGRPFAGRFLPPPTGYGDSDMPLRATLATALAIASLAGVGCGADEEGDAAAVAERFGAALERDDGGAACDVLSTTAASAVERQEQAPCEEAILRLDLPRDAVAAKSRVYLLSASVDLAGGGVIFLSEGPAGWRISAAGCTPSAPGQPYDCELEG